jgi:F0F1-type ATP synthase delta subunit
MRVSIRQYAGALLDLEPGLVPEQTAGAAERFVLWLKRRGEAKRLPAILGEAERLLKERAGQVDVEIGLARVVGSEVQEQLKSQVEEVFPGKKLAVTFATDETLIGGARFRSEEVLYDVSLSRALKELRKSLTQ